MSDDRLKLFKSVNKSLMALEISTRDECLRIRQDLVARCAAEGPFLRDFEIWRVRIQFFWKATSKRWNDESDNIAASGEIAEDSLGIPVIDSGFCRIFEILIDQFGCDDHLKYLLKSHLGDCWVEIVTWHQGHLRDFVGQMAGKEAAKIKRK